MQNKINNYYGHGKLLLTGEYAVLDGAKALAIPTKFGQHLEVFQIPDGKSEIHWESYDINNNMWLQYDNIATVKSSEQLMLEKILQVIDEMNPTLFSNHSFRFTTKLEFDRKWGLGSSSTLLYCLAEWAQIDMFELLERTFGGSGYDLASASCDEPIFYTKNGKSATWATLQLDFPFKENLYFVYLGKKKNSREAISHYRESKSTAAFIAEISSLSDDMSTAESLEELQSIMIVHEELLSKRLLHRTINQTYFSDNKKVVGKSLGGWGGDFILVATEMPKEALTSYLLTKGLDVALSWDEMIFKK
jgi:mevalonate kinase